MNKKASITMSISWVFMIIVGVFFIMLAYNIVSKYMANEEAKYEIELKNVLNTKLNQIGRTSGIEESSIAPVGNIFQDKSVEILCEDSMAILSLNGKLDANNQYLQNYPTFMTYISQDKIDNSFLLVENFRMPFKIRNLLAIASSRNLIIIDKDSNFGKKLYQKFRKKDNSNQINYKIESFDSLNINYLKSRSYFKGYKYNSIIFVTDENQNLNINLDHLDVLSYIVKIEEINENYGKIIYTDKENKKYSFDYYDYEQTMPLQTMAVFSRPETFNCSYNLLINSVEEIYGFYMKKSNTYMDYSNDNKKVCINTLQPVFQHTFYSDFYDKLNETQTFINTNRLSDGSGLNEKLSFLDNQQLILEKNSCPYIY